MFDIDGVLVDSMHYHAEAWDTTLKTIGITAEECLVIENAPFGVQSAKNAGLRCVAVATYLDRKYLKDADMIADNHKDIGKCIRMVEHNEIE